MKLQTILHLYLFPWNEIHQECIKMNCKITQRNKTIYEISMLFIQEILGVYGLYSLSRAPRTGKWKPTNHLLVSQSKNGTGTVTMNVVSQSPNWNPYNEKEKERYRQEGIPNLFCSRQLSTSNFLLCNWKPSFFPLSSKTESNLHDYLGYLIPFVTDFRCQVKLTVKS